MKPKAYSYIRFSTAEQAKGDSFRRQSEWSKSYAEQHGLDLDQALNMFDRGLSAFRGRQHEVGALGIFSKAVEAGQIPKGSYLLVESLDRLSRESPNIALTRFLDLTNNGIIIVTRLPEKVYSGEIDGMDLMISLVSMIRSNEESVVRADRVGRSWQHKINNASTQPVTKWVPSWLRVENGKIVAIPDRVRVVKQIYEWAAAGLGTSLIIRKLDDLKILPWGVPDNISVSGGHLRNRVPKKWYPSYIQRILHNRAVLGEYHPRGQKGGQLVIKDYYPVIVKEQQFFQVQKARASRNVNAGGSGAGRKGKELTNLFSGLLVCGYSLADNNSNYKCAGTNQSMFCAGKGPKSKTRYLQCSRQRDGNSGCDKCRKYWRYNDFENQFLEHVSEVDIQTLFGKLTDSKRALLSLKDEIESVQGRIENNTKEIKKLAVALSSFGTIPKFMIEQGQEYESANIELKRNLDGLNAEYNYKLRTAAEPEDRHADLIRLVSDMGSLSGSELFDARFALSNSIKEIVDKIEVYPNGSFVTDEYLASYEGKPKIFRMLKDLQQRYPNGSEAYFIVKYKTGWERAIHPYSEAPELYDVTKNADGSMNIVGNGQAYGTGYSVKVGIRHSEPTVTKRKPKNKKK